MMNQNCEGEKRLLSCEICVKKKRYKNVKDDRDKKRQQADEWNTSMKISDQIVALH